MGFSLLALLLTALMVEFLRQQKALEQRIASQRGLSREQLVPRHYKSFTQVERELWEAVREQNRVGVWEEVRFRQRGPEFQIVRGYIRGLSEDFQRGHRIFGKIILHSPEMKLFAQLEWERLKIELAYHFWRAMLGFRLRTVGVSIKELRQLTEIVATLAYRVRTMLTALDKSGNIQFVDSILRQS